MKTVIKQNWRQWTTILIFSLLILIPQLYQPGHLIFGVDGVFHYNRFYDAYMQIKEHNFQPFIMMYGFGQVGRYINVIYSPLLAYLAGGILFVVKSYYKLQLILNFSVLLAAGLSMYYMLAVGKLRRQVQLYGALSYMLSFPVIAWIFGQQFTGVGAAFLPLVGALAIRLVVDKTKPVIVVEMIAIMTLIIQTHVLSAVLAVILMVLAYAYSVITNPNQRLKTFGKIALSAVMTLILTVNIWGAYLFINVQDAILPPFPFAYRQQRLMNWNFQDKFTAPTILMLTALFMVLFWTYRKSVDKGSQYIGYLGVAFLLLASGLLPIDFLVKKIPAVAILQFPFRLAPIGIMLITYAGLKALEKGAMPQGIRTVWLIFVKLFILMGIFTVTNQFNILLNDWNKPKGAIPYYYTTLDERVNKPFAVQEAFASHDLSKPWSMMTKTVPDYLPKTSDADKLYQAIDQVPIVRKIEQYYLTNHDFNKAVRNKKIYITWKQKQAGTVNLPVVHYQGTQYVLDNKKVGTNEVKTGPVGTSQMQVSKGQHQVAVSYRVR